MTRPPFPVLAAVLVVIGAGSPTACSGDDGPSAPSSTPTTTTVVTLPPAERQEVAGVVARATDFSRPLTERLEVLEDAEDLQEVAARVTERFTAYGVTVTVVDVQGGQDPDQAVAVVDVMMGEAPLLNDAPVAVRSSGGAWRVTRDGLCTVIATVTPCPEAAAGS